MEFYSPGIEYLKLTIQCTKVHQNNVPRLKFNGEYNGGIGFHAIRLCRAQFRSFPDLAFAQIRHFCSALILIYLKN